MKTQYIINEEGVATGVILSIRDYQRLLLNQRSAHLPSVKSYKTIIDELVEEAGGKITYVSFETIKKRFDSQ